MDENWYTGIFYKVKGTGRVGEQIECPCDDPIILEHTPGVPRSRRVYWLKDVVTAKMPTKWQAMKADGLAGTVTHAAKNGHKGARPATIRKFLRIYEYIKRSDAPVRAKEIQEAVRFNCYYYLGNPASNLKFSLETLGIIERVPLKRTWVAWKLTKHGLRDGEQIIRSKYEEGL